jgi:two-component system, NtrC family, response regulator AtoC
MSAAPPSAMAALVHNYRKRTRGTLMKEENPLSAVQTPVPSVRASSELPASRSQTMRELEHAITDIGHADLPVLLVGEKGTGKEIIARQIHQHRVAADAPFLRVACSEHQPRFLKDLFEETARVAREKPGHSATVFLDEIGDLNLPCQTALIEAMVNGDGQAQVERLGARVISATSRNLEEEIRKEHFREDLFYRLNGICLRVPPLRHRKEDIPALMEFFLKVHAESLGCVPTVLEAKTLQILLQHAWPGNVRELEEVAKRILLSGEQNALAGLNGAAAQGSTAAGGFSAVLSLKEAARNASRQVERELILKTLARTRWNRKRAARELGISYKALLYKLKQIAFDDPTGI